MFNKNKLLGKIAEAGLTQRTLVNEMMRIGCKISENTFSSRMNGKTSFDIDEAEIICSILCISDPKDRAEIFLNSVSQ
jgi:hypothetical protein